MAVVSLWLVGWFKSVPLMVLLACTVVCIKYGKYSTKPGQCETYSSFFHLVLHTLNTARALFAVFALHAWMFAPPWLALHPRASSSFNNREGG